MRRDMQHSDARTRRARHNSRCSAYGGMETLSAAGFNHLARLVRVNELDLAFAVFGGLRDDIINKGFYLLGTSQTATNSEGLSR